MVATYQGIKRVEDARLPQFFSEFPPVDYEIREMEAYRAAHVPGAQYQAAPPDKSRPGVFFGNC